MLGRDRSADAPGLATTASAGGGDAGDGAVPPRRGHSLRAELFALFLASTVAPLLLTNTWGYLQTRENLVDAEREHLRNLAAVENSHAAELVGEAERLVASIASNGAYLVELLRGLQTEPPDVRAASLQALQSHLRTESIGLMGTTQLFLVDPGARLLAASPEDLGEVLDGAWLRACWRRAVVGPAVPAVRYGARAAWMLIASPVRGAGDATALGALCARFDMSGELVALRNAGHPVATSVYLLDTGGRVAAASTAEAAGAVSVGDSVTRARPVPTLTGPWQARYPVAGEGDVLAAFVPSPGGAAGVLVEVPVAAALRSLDVLKWEAVAFAGVVVALVALALIAVARRITGPLVSLSAAARRASLGELGVRVPVDGTAEAADLSRAFNVMIGAVRDAKDNLEQRIEARTRDLRASHELAERLLDSIAEPMLVIGRDHRVIKANSAAAARYGADLVGRDEAALAGGDGAASADDTVAVTFATGNPSRAERVERLDDENAVVSVHTSPVMSDGEEVASVIQIRRVVTAERRQHALELQQQRLATFGLVAASVAHEIGNPLAAIASQIALARAAPEPDRIQETLEITAREVRRMTGLLRELGSLARRPDAASRRVSLPGVLDNTAALLRHDPRSRGVDIEVACAGAAPPVFAREDRLVQLFLNLGLNAIDAMPSGGVLRFEAEPDAAGAAVRIVDSGTGIPEDACGRIFEPFFSTKEEGTGLGLFVCQGIVDELGGALDLERSGPDGTVFRVTLPLGAPPATFTGAG